MKSLLEHIFSGNGPIAEALGPAYEPRREQIDMALAVADAMAARSHLLVEAGTGVGKSYAYLVPAIVRAAALGETVIVATNTIALQEQLIEKDIPLLKGTMAPADEPHPDDNTVPLGVSAKPQWSGSLRTALVKGRGNYLSIRRLKLASERQDRLFGDPAARRTLHAIEDWAYSTPDGSLATLPQMERPGVWDRVQSDSTNCMGRKCPTYQQCFYQRSRRTMEQANLLICNHALFFSDLALRADGVGFLPKYDHVILDEAHGVEDAASDHFGLTLSETRVAHLLSMLYQPRSGKGYIPQLALLVGDVSLVDAAVHATLRADAAMRAIFDDLAQEHSRRAVGRSSTARIGDPGFVDNPLSPAMTDLALALKALKQDVKGEPDKFELNSYIVRAEEIADAARALIDQSVAGCVYWTEVARGSEDQGGPFARARRVTLAAAPVEVGPLLRQKLFAGECSVTLTSATLAARVSPGAHGSPDFDHVKKRLGCENAATLLLGSPFDYVRQVRVFVDPTMPSPKTADASRARTAPGADDRRIVPVDDSGGEIHRSAAPYADQLSTRILEHIDATDGGAFVLFTSFAAIDAAARALHGPLADRGMPLLVQGKSGSRSEILSAFRSSDRSVLLGASSFWQGVDVRGRGLRNVIITRLPFEPPDRPLTEARLELIASRGGDPFMEDSLPRAIIRFKQGFGRLIRSRSDSGRVVVLDPRVLTTRYGRFFLSALPEGLQVITGRGEV